MILDYDYLSNSKYVLAKAQSDYDKRLILSKAKFSYLDKADGRLTGIISISDLVFDLYDYLLEKS